MAIYLIYIATAFMLSAIFFISIISKNSFLNQLNDVCKDKEDPAEVIKLIKANDDFKRINDEIKFEIANKDKTCIELEEKKIPKEDHKMNSKIINENRDEIEKHFDQYQVRLNLIEEQLQNCKEKDKICNQHEERLNKHEEQIQSIIAEGKKNTERLIDRIVFLEEQIKLFEEHLKYRKNIELTKIKNDKTEKKIKKNR